MSSKYFTVDDNDVDGAPLPTSDDPSEPVLAANEPTPAWAQLGGHNDTGANSRLGRRYSLGRAPAARTRTGRLAQRGHALAVAAAKTARTSAEHLVAFFLRLPPLQRLFFVLAVAFGFTFSILMLVYSHRIFSALGPMARGWREMRGGWVIVWLLISVTAFPPIIGYSTACTAAGIVYGFPGGWPIAASANVIGSLLAFLASRGVLSRFVDSLVGHDPRFVALGHVLRHDGLWILAAVRFCPLPYSLSNGFLATIPSVTPMAFALSTAMASPKLLVHVFIGSRLAKLAEEGDSMSAGSKAINYISMMVFSLVGAAVGYFIFRRTMARAAELANDGDLEQGAAGAVGSGHGSRTSSEDGPYVDSEHEELLDPEDDDVAALMDDDDISLWAADHFADGDGTGNNSSSAAAAAEAGHIATVYRVDDEGSTPKAPAAGKR